MNEPAPRPETALAAAALPVPTPVPSPAPVRDRLIVRAVLRWTAAVLVFATAGATTAYAVTRPERTDLPGLATPHDGRWTYPELKLPRLPSEAPSPQASANSAGRHYADIRRLLLPMPLEAKSDSTFPGTGEWLPEKVFLTVFDNRQKESDRLHDEGCQRIAARAWTTRDGTRTEVYLLRFSSTRSAGRYHEGATSGAVLKDAPPGNTVEGLDLEGAGGDFVRIIPYADEDEPGFRFAWMVAGDVVGLVRTTHKEKVPTVPYEQTLILQSQLLR